MNGAQDVGGMMSFGPIDPANNDESFHAAWQRLAMGTSLLSSAMGPWPIDETRLFRESLPPAVYYASSYFEIWIRALENILKTRGFVTDADLAAGQPVDPAPKPARVLGIADVDRILAHGTPYERPIDTPPRFAVGDAVRARNINPTGHTRLPRYARGRLGTIEAVHGGFVFPDTNAHGQGENPQRLYTVAFTAIELWGEGADPHGTVSIDAFESYLDAA